MTETEVSPLVSVYSQNVSCDRLSEKLVEIEGMEKFNFENRIVFVVDTLKKLDPLPDVVAMNEVRYDAMYDKQGFYKKCVKGFRGKMHSI